MLVTRDSHKKLKLRNRLEVKYLAVFPIFLYNSFYCAGSCDPGSRCRPNECIFGSRNSRGSGFWNEGYISKGREMGRSVYEQPGNEVDGSYHSKEGSK